MYTRKINKKLKTFKFYKTKNCLKNEHLTMFFHMNNLNKSNWLQIEQNFYKNKLKCDKINNSVTKQVFQQSILSNLTILIQGSLCIIYPEKNQSVNVRKVINLNKKIPLLGLKLNKNVYSKAQLNDVSTLNYRDNVKMFHKTIKQCLKIPYYKF